MHHRYYYLKTYFWSEKNYKWQNNYYGAQVYIRE